MKSILGLVAITGLALVLAACNGAESIGETTTEVNGVKASLIAVVDGCNVWQLTDGGLPRPVYMSKCPGDTSADMQRSYTSGKTTATQQTIGAN